MGERIRFRDIKPYYVPQSLSDLHGPLTGKIKLRHSVMWAPGDGIIDIGTEGGLHRAYQALLAEGLVEDQVEGLNARRPIEEWPNLRLDRRVRQLWEDRFPELRRRRTIQTEDEE